jgi:hypothetical protein
MTGSACQGVHVPAAVVTDFARWLAWEFKEQTPPQSKRRKTSESSKSTSAKTDICSTD